MEILRLIFLFFTLIELIVGQSIKYLTYPCHYIKHDIEYILSSSTTSVSLTQNGVSWKFEQQGKKFTLNLENTDIQTGPALLTQFYNDNKEISVEINLTDIFFEPDLKGSFPFQSVDLTKMNCNFNRENLALVTNVTGQEEEMNLNETMNNCTLNFSDYLPGPYQIIAKNPYSNQTVYVSNFTLLVNKTDQLRKEFDVQIPLQNLNQNNGIFNFTITYPYDFEEIKYINIQREQDNTRIQLTKESFIYYPHGNSYFYTVSFSVKESGIIYHLDSIVMDNDIFINFNEYEYSFGNFFHIKNNFILRSSNEMKVELEFYASDKNNEYQNRIYYKNLEFPEEGSKKLECEIKEDFYLTCNVKRLCKSVYAIGIDQNLISFDFIYIFRVHLGFNLQNDLCFLLSDVQYNDPIHTFIYLPSELYLNNLDIVVTVMGDDSKDCTKENSIENIYDFACNLNTLNNDGNYYIEIDIKFGQIHQKLMIEDPIIVVMKSATLQISQPQKLVLTNEKQTLQLTTSKTPPNQIKKIQLYQNDKISNSFEPEKTGENSLIFTIQNLADSQFFVNTFADIYYNHPCPDNNTFISGKATISIEPINITSMNSTEISIKGNETILITFSHAPAGTNSQLVFQ